MPLDDKRQALLDVFCHCYERLLNHLDVLDAAAQAHPEWDAYRIAKECLNPATEEFGSAEVKTLDLSTLCGDFLARAEGFIIGKFGSDSPVVGAFAECRETARVSPVSTQVDLTSWQRLGEELSREYYQDILPADSSNLAKAVKPVCIQPSKKQVVGCIPQKTGGASEITFNFASPEFVLQSYVNLPLYFFHEYLSHIHTAPLFGELHGPQKPFEDGWLLYCIRAAYRNRLFHDPHSQLTHPLHREHYAGRYFQAQNDDASNEPWVPYGFELARCFETVVGSDLFRRATLLLAISAYNYFPGVPDLHGEFVKRVDQWLGKIATLPTQEKDAKVEHLARLLEEDEPLKGLMEFLIRG